MSALFPIADLAALICASSARHKVIAVMREYFDDTGTHVGSPVTASAGLVGTTAEWTSLEGRWRSKLAQYDLTDFHASECAWGRPPYDRLKPIERDSLVRELANLVADHNLMPVSSAVHLEPWEQLKNGGLSKAPSFFSRYPRPFILCFDHCVQISANWTKVTAEGEPVSLIFNEQRSDAAAVGEIFDAYKASKRWGSSLDTLTFAPSRGRPPLQAVDLLANETFHYWLDLVADPTIPLRPALSILWRRFDFSLARFYGLTGLVEAMRRFVP